MTEFKHKDRTITVTSGGAFEFLDKLNRPVRKPSLKAAQTAIDKEVGTIVLPCMTGDGKRLEVVERHKGGGYIDPQGYRVGLYGRIYSWNEEASVKLAEIRERESAENQRHQTARDALRDERSTLLEGLGEFNLEAAQAAALVAHARVESK